MRAGLQAKGIFDGVDHKLAGGISKEELESALQKNDEYSQALKLGIQKKHGARAGSCLPVHSRNAGRCSHVSLFLALTFTRFHGDADAESWFPTDWTVTDDIDTLFKKLDM